MAKKPEKIFGTQIGSLVPSITKASFERYGFAYADLAGKWEAIMGHPLCTQCSPKKIAWPRGVKYEHEKTGGILHLSCLSAFALDLQHRQNEIIERINRFYGYQAIKDISFFQTNSLAQEEPEKPKAPPLSEEDKNKITESVKDISDNRLAKALQGLGEHVLSEGKNKD